MDDLWECLSVELPSAKHAIDMPEFQHDRLLTLSLLDTSSLDRVNLPAADQTTLKAEYHRLAYLGDALIDAALADYLFSSFSHLTKQQMNTLRESLVSRNALCQYAIQLDWPNYCTSRNRTDRKPPEDEAGIYGEMFEVLAAAIFIEFNRDFLELYDWLVDKFLRSQVKHFLPTHLPYK